MSRLFAIIRNSSHFINHKLWRLRANKLDKRQGFLIKQLRIFTLAIKGFNEDKCLLKASALTYYLLFSIVPVIALAFAIAKGFGFEKKLQENLLQDFSEQQEVLKQVFTYANEMLSNTKGGLIAGIGVVLLLWSVMKLLGNIEDSFNEIWEIKKGRGFVRKFTDYLSVILIAPIFIIISGSITVIIKSQLDTAMSTYTWLQHIGPAFMVLLKLISFFLITFLFTFIYMVLPNTKVKFAAAFKAALVAAILFELLEWGYITFQIGVAQYSAIYGSFAALPLFLIWVQYSWFIVLFGAELAFANQHVDHYELENEIQGISIRYKRVLALLIANKVVKNFIEGKAPLTAEELAMKLDLPVRLVRSIIFEFTESGIFNGIAANGEKDLAYQPGMSESKLSVRYIINTMEKKGVNEMPIQHTHELDSIQGLMDEFDKVLDDNKGNVLVKDIL
jgi:membrane protein